MPAQNLPIHAVILAGGRGTRFWPRSRTKTPKQLLEIFGKGTMFEQTVARLRPLIPAHRLWTVTNTGQSAALKKQLPAAARHHVLVEPVGRNTAAATALAAFHIRHAAKSDALMAVLPADHFIAQPKKYREIVAAALDVAREPGRMVVLGIPPKYPETGFGYIEQNTTAFIKSRGQHVFAVRRFTEKPALEQAKEYIASGNYLWNAGMFFWRVSTFLDNLRQHLPATYAALEKLAASIGTRRYEKHLRAVYPKLENISVDYAVLERATQSQLISGPRQGTASAAPSNKPENQGFQPLSVSQFRSKRTYQTSSSLPTPPQVFVIPAEMSWSDIGSWGAVYGLQVQSGAADTSKNVILSPGYALDSSGNFISVPGKFTALVGASDLIIVETRDALLICPRGRAQDVSKLVKLLEHQKLKYLL